MTACTLTAKAGPAVGMGTARQLSCATSSMRITKIDGAQLNGARAPLCIVILKEQTKGLAPGTGLLTCMPSLALRRQRFLQFPKNAVQYQLHHRRATKGSEGWKYSCCLSGAKHVCQWWQRELRLLRSGTSCANCRAVDV